MAYRSDDAIRSRQAVDSSEFNRTSNLRGLRGEAFPILEQQSTSGNDGLIGRNAEQNSRNA